MMACRPHATSMPFFSIIIIISTIGRNKMADTVTLPPDEFIKQFSANIRNWYNRIDTGLSGAIMLLVVVFLVNAANANGQGPLVKMASASVSAGIIGRDQMVEMGSPDSVLFQYNKRFSRQLSDTIIPSRHLHIKVLNCE